MKPNIIKLLSAGILLTIGTAACTNEETASSGKEVAVNISSGVNTRAVNTTWEKDDAIGVTMVKSKDDATVVAAYRNCKYTVKDKESYQPQEKEDFNPAGAENIMYFPIDGSTVSFKAYYPYNGELPETMIMPLSVASQTSLAGIDLMTAEHMTGDSKDNPNVHLRFYHRLCKVIFNLEAEEGSGIDLAGCRLAIKGMNTTGSYDLMSETIAITDESIANINVPVSGATATGIVLPRPAGEGVTFEVTTANRAVYTAILPADVPFESGKVNTLGITLKKTKPTVTADIADWTGGHEKDMEAVHIIIDGGGTVQGFETNDEITFYQIGSDNKVAGTNKGTVKENGTTGKVIGLESDWDAANMIGSHISAVSPASINKVAVGGDSFEWTSFDTTTQKNKEDILTAVSPDITAETSGNIPLSFDHALSKVTVNIIAGTGFTVDELKGVTVALQNLFLKGTVNVAAGTATASTTESDKTASFTPEKLSTTTGSTVAASYEALVMPQTVTAATALVTATYSGIGYTSTVADLGISGDLVLEPGKNNTINITFQKTGVSFTTSVAGWRAGTSGSATIE